MKTKNVDTAVSRLTNYNIINNIGKKKRNIFANIFSL